jgi:hypothetical protein
VRSEDTAVAGSRNGCCSTLVIEERHDRQVAGARPGDARRGRPVAATICMERHNTWQALVKSRSSVYSPIDAWERS